MLKLVSIISEQEEMGGFTCKALPIAPSQFYPGPRTTVQTRATFFMNGKGGEPNLNIESCVHIYTNTSLIVSGRMHLTQIDDLSYRSGIRH